MYYDVFSYLVDYILKMIYTTGLCMQHGEKIVPAPKKSNFNVLASFQHSYYDIAMKMLFWRYFDRELILESAISSLVAS